MTKSATDMDRILAASQVDPDEIEEELEEI
jgi:hypothetical protein